MKVSVFFAVISVVPGVLAATFAGQLPVDWLGVNYNTGDNFFWKLKVAAVENIKRQPALAVLFSEETLNDDKPVEIRIEGYSFNPPLVAVRTSQQLVLDNTTDLLLACRARGARNASLEPFKPGKKQQLTVMEQGLWLVDCPPFNFMQLAIFSGKVAYSVRVENDGTFKLPDVRPGQYTLKVLVGDKWLGERPVTVANQPVFIDLRSPEQKEKERQPHPTPPGPEAQAAKPVTEKPAAAAKEPKVEKPPPPREHQKPPRVQKPVEPAAEGEEASEPAIEVEEE